MFSDVKDSMKISREEIFGPVQCISKWSTMDEVSCSSVPYIMLVLLAWYETSARVQAPVVLFCAAVNARLLWQCLECSTQAI